MTGSAAGVVAAPPLSERQVQRSILRMCGSCFREVLIHHSPNGTKLAGNPRQRKIQGGVLIGDWMKADARQVEMFRDDADVQMGLGYWTRANTEYCLLATRGKPRRLSKSVRQGIIEPRRQHSRKPDCVYGRIEQLVEGPYLELFARTQRPGWTAWGNQTDRFGAAA